MKDRAHHRQSSASFPLLPGERKVAGPFVYNPANVLGEGASGRAYRGRNASTGAPIALKIFVVESVRLAAQLERRQRDRPGSTSPPLTLRGAPPTDASEAAEPTMSAVSTPLSPASAAFPTGTRAITPDEVSILYWLQGARCANIVHLHAAFYHDPQHRHRTHSQTSVQSPAAQPAEPPAQEMTTTMRTAASGESSTAADSQNTTNAPTTHTATQHLEAATDTHVGRAPPLSLPPPLQSGGAGDKEEGEGEVGDGDEAADREAAAETDTDLPMATFVVVTDYCEGGDLRTHLRQHGAMNVWLVRAWAYQLLNALTVLHHAGVMHRDIKPDNILLTCHRAAAAMPLSPLLGRAARWPPRAAGRSPVPATPTAVSPTVPFASSSSLSSPPPPSTSSAAPSAGAAAAASRVVSAKEAALCQWTVRLADFGTAVRLPSRDRQGPHLWTRDDRDREGHSGSLLYLAPERLNKASYHESADLYATGVVLLEMLHGGPLHGTATGEFDEAALAQGAMARLVPEVGERWRQTVTAHAEEARADPSLALQFADQAVALLSRMLGTDPTQRPSAWEALAHPFFRDPRAAASGETASCDVPAWPAPGPTPPRPRPVNAPGEDGPLPLPSLAPLTLAPPDLSPLSLAPHTPLSPVAHGSERRLDRSPALSGRAAADLPWSSRVCAVVQSLPPSSALLPQRAPPPAAASLSPCAHALDGFSPPPALRLPAAALSLVGSGTVPSGPPSPAERPVLTTTEQEPATRTEAIVPTPPCRPHESFTTTTTTTTTTTATPAVSAAVLADATRVYVSTLLTHGMPLALAECQADAPAGGAHEQGGASSVEAVLTYAAALRQHAEQALEAAGETPTRRLDLSDEFATQARTDGGGVRLWLTEAASVIQAQCALHHVARTAAVSGTSDRRDLQRVLTALVTGALVRAARAEGTPRREGPAMAAVRETYRQALAVTRVLLQVIVTPSPVEPAQRTVPCLDLFDGSPAQRANLQHVAHVVAHHLGNLH